MRWFFRIFILLVLLSVLLSGAYGGVLLFKSMNKPPVFREAEVVKGELVSVVNATGTIEPIKRIHVGANVSGPVVKVYADYNDIVEKDQLLAQIDPRLQEAAVTRDEATLVHAEADLERTTARLERSESDYERAKALREENEEFISDTELDQYRTECKALRAEIRIAEAGVTKAKAALENSKTNLKYTDIVAPESGVILDRKIEEGQTVASSFQVPDLFIVAPRLEEEIHIHASIVEADIGRIREAEEEGCPVSFTVDAYPDELFEGRIQQVRMNPVRVDNVVTYPVIVAAENPGMRLLPGMTADLSFEVKRHDDILKIPNAALRFYPSPEQVHPDDRDILEGSADQEDEEDDIAGEQRRSATQRIAAREGAERRHVWVRKEEFLRAVEVWAGVNDYKYTELADGELTEGMKLVTGIQE